LRIVEPDPPIALIQQLCEQIQARDDLAELNGETQVAALL